MNLGTLRSALQRRGFDDALAPFYVDLARGRNAEYARNFETGCWEWLGTIHDQGYGMTSKPGPFGKMAHRQYYGERHGSIPGEVIDHLCRVRHCVNPDHLEAVTQAVNVQRGAWAKLTWADVDAIRASDLPGVELARQYGVSQPTISQVRSGKTWKREAA